MFFQPRTAPRPEHVPVHLDLTVPWGQPGTVGRPPGRSWGAAPVDVLDEVPWARWSTCADPDGNLFCVAEQPPVVEVDDASGRAATAV